MSPLVISRAWELIQILVGKRQIDAVLGAPGKNALEARNRVVPKLVDV